MLNEDSAQESALNFILEEAITQTGKVADVSGLMAMCSSILTQMRTQTKKQNLNIVWSWKITLAESLSMASRFTTSMATEAITELKTLGRLLQKRTRRIGS